MKHILFTLVFCFFGAFAHAEESTTLDKLIEDVESDDGAELRVHGVYEAYGLYVFSWWNLKNFRDRYDFPVYSRDLKLVDFKLKRHDKILITGEVETKNRGPEHLRVDSLKVIERYTGHGTEKRPRTIDLGDLVKKSRAVFKIHTISKTKVDGTPNHLMVVEYEKVVLPMFVSKWSDELDKLSRNDSVEMSFKLKRSPKSPPHLFLDNSKPIKRLLNIKDQHSKDADITGCLVRFPKSPQIKFDVFAVTQTDKWGHVRNYTLLNFSDFELFTNMRKKIAKLWASDKDKSHIEFRRGRFLNCSLQLRVKGTFNVVSSNQANPQVLISSLDDIEVIKK